MYIFWIIFEFQLIVTYLKFGFDGFFNGSTLQP